MYNKRSLHHLRGFKQQGAHSISKVSTLHWCSGGTTHNMHMLQLQPQDAVPHLYYKVGVGHNRCLHGLALSWSSAKSEQSRPGTKCLIAIKFFLKGLIATVLKLLGFLFLCVNLPFRAFIKLLPHREWVTFETTQQNSNQKWMTNLMITLCDDNVAGL